MSSPRSRSASTQCDGLVARPREPVEHDALGAVGFGDPLEDHRDHQVVGTSSPRST
jgi:hypothetical protein